MQAARQDASEPRAVAGTATPSSGISRDTSSDESGTRRAAERINILLVDDRPENLVALSAVLDDPAYNLVTVNSGPEALRAVLREDFALILLDVLMPGMDGFEVASIIKQRERGRYVPIIFLTAVGNDINFIYRGYSAGAVDYLVKPIDPDVVRAKVAVFVDLHRKTRQIEAHAARLSEIERRERESRLAELQREGERRYQNLADAIPQIVWTARPDGSADHFNRRWLEYTGMTIEQSLAWGWAQALHPDDSTRFLEQWRAATAARAAYQSECRLRRADGAYRWHLCRAVGELDARGEIVAWLGTLTDIDDQKQAEAERLRLYGEAQIAVRARDEFLSIASHELKTPLTALKLQVKTLWRSVTRALPGSLPPETIDQRLTTVDRQVDRLTKLIDNLLDISRITSGRIDLELHEVDLATVVREATERVQEDLVRANCVLSVDSVPSVTGRWDGLRLDQVVTNLLSNAMKYGAGKPIALHLEAIGESGARLVIRDEGIGIAPEKQARIFERFERAVSERQYGGFGLGLWIVRQIVEALGGEVRVTSEPGVGSTFTVDLPRSGPPPGGAVERPSRDAPSA